GRGRAGIRRQDAAAPRRVPDGGGVVTRALFTLMIVWGAPAFADVAVPDAGDWRDGCAARIDEAARQLGLLPGARVNVFPLVHEDGTPNPVRYVQYGSGELELTVGEETERRPDVGWHAAEREPNRSSLFRRRHGRFAKMLNTDNRVLKRALAECL